jgi:hypothetical protein
MAATDLPMAIDRSTDRPISRFHMTKLCLTI